MFGDSYPATSHDTLWERGNCLSFAETNLLCNFFPFIVPWFIGWKWKCVCMQVRYQCIIKCKKGMHGIRNCTHEVIVVNAKAAVERYPKQACKFCY
jgi:hypothetical protein